MRVGVPWGIYKVIMDDKNSRELQQLSLSGRPPTYLFILYIYQPVLLVNQWVLLPERQRLRYCFEPLVGSQFRS